jgi:fumarate hydratase subunit alpha
MNDGIYQTIETVGRDLYIKALQDIPQDVRAALASAHETEQREGNKTASQVMFTILENVKAADEESTLVCQDTGLPIYKVRVGTKLQLNLARVAGALRRACERATAERPLRSNSVHPLNRKNTGTNTGQGLPIIKWEFVPDSDLLEIVMAPKGSGSENMSFLKMLNPSEGVRGIKKFVLQCIFDSGACPCPPVIVGIGLGGTSDVAAALAKEASCFRKVGTANADAEVAALEKELLEKINQTGIGPQGMGGAVTALAVNIEWAHTHISHNPVAVNLQCWRGERAGAVISPDCSVSFQ